MRPIPTTPTGNGLPRRASSSARYTADLEASKGGARMSVSPVITFAGQGRRGGRALPRRAGRAAWRRAPEARRAEETAMPDSAGEFIDPERRLWVPWTRRKFLGAAGLTAAGLAAGPLLEACGGGGSSQSSSSPSSTKVPQPRSGASIRLLQWVHFVPAADTEFIRQCEEFGGKYGVKVAVERITADQLQTKTAAAVEASSGPDIIQMQYGRPHLYTSQCEDVTNEVNALKQKVGSVATLKDAGRRRNGGSPPQ